MTEELHQREKSPSAKVKQADTFNGPDLNLTTSSSYAIFISATSLPHTLTIRPKLLSPYLIFVG
jgi:hypothetical protein